MKKTIMSDSDIVEFGGLPGKSFAFKAMVEVATRMAAHDVPILLEGEVGSGKEWLARSIHFSSPKSKGEFIVVDCSSFSDVLLESELFGYVRGSFVGSIHDKKGLLEIARDGTVFLNHIEALSLPTQGKLLRFIGEGSFFKIGGVASIKSNARMMIGTDQDLKALVLKKKFRDDLFFQLNVIKITIPPLRERREDISVLADNYLMWFTKEAGIEPKQFSPEAKSILETYDWPGNVKELEKEIEKSVIMAKASSKITPNFISQQLKRKQKKIDSAHQPAIFSGSLKERKRYVIAELEREAIREALEKTSGNRTQAAKLLDVSRQELIRKIALHKIRS
ncbi:MAG: hypothetical protein A3G33_00860 [Omnitrophica bacterium RIFCSPLOWO2_12_FULL_44_17]|uniref:Sigma-54 factor interaction domain-containing protein n=1 Tax=Candidatus Danuiimicrobium aquiferis TaxID=1801832 RepID=A0A1G1L2R2_9BACT|nr:MAG: hypothetical protein A3B72_06340 [Omnitrophica bacterium RIFCSPHIGHO2_02_FULL_45_28]OGW89786.1 MAG: hypothetical protein A3E74_07470 [Omnitrophica bacterium RIFCSPHIGHO2_12_FULL_44_12]OGW99430.1 MAG: hypothetical protein A3G33_00860 [Omnitrophica bacterium RIFCSPLOWO2_12_FULL_44_17]OGX03042.1 MAG: hypothetical protein A3J12_04845 [Omnitrophica bacterium RIFCSPLOWO2_02_FULL_44_11]